MRISKLGLEAAMNAAEYQHLWCPGLAILPPSFARASPSVDRRGDGDRELIGESGFVDPLCPCRHQCV